MIKEDMWNDGHIRCCVDENPRRAKIQLGPLLEFEVTIHKDKFLHAHIHAAPVLYKSWHSKVLYKKLAYKLQSRHQVLMIAIPRYYPARFHLSRSGYQWIRSQACARTLNASAP